ncbi:MAG: hypothetical protein U0736_20620 [Gemmataceae bacterium]
MVENTLDVGGGVVFWSLAEWTTREALHDGLVPLALEGMTPEPRQASACLREALCEVFAGPRMLIRPLNKREGFVVVREERGETSNAYNQELLARILTNGNGSGNGCHGGVANGAVSIDFQPPHTRCPDVLDAFRRQQSLLHAGQVSACLVNVVEGLGGTRLRPGGALYWLPGHRLDEWLAVSRAVEQAAHQGKSSVYLLRHRMDAEAVRAIQDAIVAEVRCEASAIHADVMSGELGERALETRRQQARDLRQKVNLYEDLLHTGLGMLHDVVDQADQAAAAAILLASAQPAEQEAGAAG